MIDSLIIKNYKSLKSVRFDLQKINLFIGPNNSGKSNVLDGLAFVFNKLLFGFKGDLFKTFRRYYYGFADENTYVFTEPISFTFIKKGENRFEYYIIEFWGVTKNRKQITRELLGVTNKLLPDDFAIRNWKEQAGRFDNLEIQALNNNMIFGDLIPDVKADYKNVRLFFVKNEKPQIEVFSESNEAKPLFLNLKPLMPLAEELNNIINKIHIFNPDPNQIKKEKPLTSDNYVSYDASNLVSFLDSMRDEFPDVFEKIKKDFTVCLPEIKDIRFKKIVIDEQTSKKIGFADKQGHVFWADEVSEGTLYFLALLAIIHQPSPPELLLIEEPEKGIHPRRLHEIMHFIFQLIDKKNIQIILTSHSPQIVNEFEDIPESIFVFDFYDGQTKVTNLLTGIIEPSDKKSQKTKLPKINFTETLGENWIYGFLGGVPK